MSTVKSTESRIFNFSIAESALMVCMAGLQVFIVRFFFQGARKGESLLLFPVSPVELMEDDELLTDRTGD